jgi:hypothetical protein
MLMKIQIPLDGSELAEGVLEVVKSLLEGEDSEFLQPSITIRQHYVAEQSGVSII